MLCIAFVTLAAIGTPLSLAPELTREFLVHHRVCPLRFEADGTLVVGLDVAGCHEAVAEVGLAYHCDAKSEAAEWSDLDRQIERLCSSAEHALRFDASPDGAFEDHVDDLGTDLRELANQPPVIRYVNALVREILRAVGKATPTGFEPVLPA